jgi:Family of unknown function (DUF6421)
MLTTSNMLVPNEIALLSARLDVLSAQGPICVPDIIGLLGEENIVSLPAIAYFLEHLKQGTTPQEIICDNLVMGWLKTQFGQPPTFEFIYFESVAVTDVIRARYRCCALPVFVLQSTCGLRGARTVAIFPEMFTWPRCNPATLPAFYFMDKFVERHQQKTQPIIRSAAIEKNSFRSLINATPHEILEACSNWVHLHEHFHGQGPMPFTKFPWIKSSRTTAALEEMRVDISSIIEALHVLPDSDYGERRSRILAEFILAERLLRYPVEARPMENYDARSSTLLLSMLSKNGATSLNNGMLAVDWSALKPALFQISREIEELELTAATHSEIEARDLLQSFVRTNSIFDKKLGGFIHHPFYEEGLIHVTTS